MSPLVATILVWVFFLGLIGISVVRAAEDGFFVSLWTFVVLLAAYWFARHEWSFLFQFLSENGMGRTQAISMGYWIGFLLVVAPGMAASRFLSRPKVPFPYPMEKHGSLLLGAGLGILLFAAVIQWVLGLGSIPDPLMEAIRLFTPLFRVLGYRKIGFD